MQKMPHMISELVVFVSRDKIKNFIVWKYVIVTSAWLK